MRSIKLIQLTLLQRIGQNVHTHNKYPDGDRVLNTEISKGFDVV